MALLELLLYAIGLEQGSPNQTPSTQSPECWARDRSPPFTLPVVFLLTQPGMHSAFATWAYCGSWATCCPPEHPGIEFGFGFLLQSCSLSSQPPGCPTARGVIPPHTQALALAFAELPEAPLSSFLQPISLPEEQGCPPVHSSLCPVWYCGHACWWCAPCHHSSHE